MRRGFARSSDRDRGGCADGGQEAVHIVGAEDRRLGGGDDHHRMAPVGHIPGGTAEFRRAEEAVVAEEAAVGERPDAVSTIIRSRGSRQTTASEREAVAPET